MPDWGMPTDRNVFVYEVKYNDKPNKADDELTEYILIQAAKGVSEFAIDNSTLSNIRYIRSCFCGQDVNTKIESGNVHGVKVSDTGWMLSGEVTVTLTGLQKRFYLKSQSFEKR